jgi:hypothetical protein
MRAGRYSEKGYFKLWLQQARKGKNDDSLVDGKPVISRLTFDPQSAP